ncbi:YbaB/EbfC family nucleoid-associated protein [Nocardia sp. NPDC127526]|uniref:YbaB/EbfC family nucleoid-associated protein n=1 Tax=Nocardia sp. NPDC127526 TaxID=3345393 RepID=UPI003628B51F
MSMEFGNPATASILEGFTQQMRAIAEASQKRARLTASATASSGRVTVTVNADGIVIATKFSASIDELSYDEIARAVTTAAQSASAEVARKVEELMRPITEDRMKAPKLSELFEGFPDLEPEAPLDIPASLAAPNSRERLSQKAEPAAEFTNSVDFDDWRSDTGAADATDRGW